ncbi:MAG: DUF4234 domain-containing protein [Candidatus Nanohaloarchaea archaeon]|nr:DUF4234 domain-containing protein [Candidatus Nanohaloarchaea archaeon]
MDELKEWAEQQLADGADESDVHDALVDRGVEPPVADELLDEVAGRVDHGGAPAATLTERSAALAAGLSFLTAGIYFLYWFYSTWNDFSDGAARWRTTLTTLLLLVPVVNIWVMWKHAAAAAAVTGEGSPILATALYIVFFPAGVYMVQSHINAAA